MILPDNDDVGRQHGTSVARGLHGHAHRVRLLALPGLPEKGDVFNWIAAGGTAEQLEALADGSPEPPASEPEPAVSKKDAKSKPRHASLKIIDPTTLAGVPIPQRVWIVEDWLPTRHVTLSYGDGGVGKTLLAQQLMTCCSAGTYWLGLEVLKCRVFGIFCEDDEDEIHRRQARILDALGLAWSDLEGMRWACAVGEDNTLVRFEPDGCYHVTPRFLELVREAKAFGAKLIVIDTAADTFGGNENDRRQVRAFLGPVLTKLAIEIDGAVLLNAHPSRSGLGAGGDIDGGSTAWSNTARSRWALTRPAADGDAEPDENLQILSRRKANYSARGEEILLRWKAGSFQPVREARAAGPVQAATEELFLTLLDRCADQGLFVSASAHAPNYAPKVFGKRPDRDGLARKDFDQAMHSLIAAGRIRVAEFGRPGKWRSRIERDASNEEAEE